MVEFEVKKRKTMWKSFDITDKTIQWTVMSNPGNKNKTNNRLLDMNSTASASLQTTDETLSVMKSQSRLPLSLNVNSNNHRKSVRPFLPTCSSWQINGCLWLKKIATSTANVSLIDTYFDPYHTHKFIVQVEVVNGIVMGTNCEFQSLLRNDAIPDSNTSGSLSQIVLDSRYDCQMFHRHSDSNVTVFSQSYQSPIVMQTVSKSMWNLLTHVVTAAHHLMKMTRIPFSEMEFPEPSTAKFKTVTLHHSMENNTNAVTSAVESIDSYQQLDPLDQLILLREHLVGVVFLFTPYLYDKDSDSLIFSALQVPFLTLCKWSDYQTFISLQDQIILGIQLNSLDDEGLSAEIVRVYSHLLNTFEEYLRQDAFVISLLCLIYFFQDIPGLFSNEEVRREQIGYVHLLDMYIKEKIKAKHWNHSYQKIWDSIYNTINIINYVRNNKIYEQFIKQKEQKIAEKMGQESMWMKEVPNSQIKYQLIKFVLTPRILYQVIIELKQCHVTNTATKYFPHYLDNLGDTHDFNESSDKIVVRFNDGRWISFSRANKNNNTQLNIQVRSYEDLTTRVMEDMESDHWDRLCQVMSALPLLQKGVQLSSELLDDNLGHISLSTSGPTIIEPGRDFFFSLPFLKSLSINNDERLLTAAVHQSGIIQLATHFDIETNSIIFYAMEGQIQMGIRLQIFHNYSIQNSFVDPVFHEFDTILRKDEVVMSLLCVLCFLQDEPQSICGEILLHERNLILQLLQSYIRSTKNMTKMSPGFGIRSQTKILGLKQFCDYMMSRP